MPKKYGRVVQNHHIQYEEPEITVKIFKGEHQVIGLMDRYSQRTVSSGFIQCLKIFIETHKDKIVDL